MSLTWEQMDSRPRRRGSTVEECDIPKTPGVYAWYRTGKRMYVGKARSLRKRIWSNHLGKGVCMTGSAFRRNVAEHLGITTAADIKARRRAMSRAEADTVCDWIREGDVVWVECESELEACSYEEVLKREYVPPLTKR